MGFFTTYLILIILIAVILTVLISKGYDGRSEQKIAVIIGLFILAALVAYFMLNLMITGEAIYIFGYIAVALIAAAVIYYRNQKAVN